MPQTSHAEPAVFSIILAISSIIYPNHSKSEDLSAKFYGTALSQVRALLTTERPNIQTVSLCCLGLVCFEILQKHNEAALTHLESCLKMLQSADTRSVRNIDPNILRCAASFDQQASQYLAARAPGIPATVIGMMGIPTGNINSAWYSLTILSSRIFYFIRSKADPFRAGEMDLDAHGIADLHSEKRALLHDLAQWSLEHEHTLEYELDRNDSEHTIKSNLLLIQHALLKIHCGTWLGPGQTIYDDFDAEFEMTVLLAQRLSNTTTFSGRELSIDTGIIEPLYITAIRCRRSDLRSAALEMLKLGVCQEGIWSSSAMGAVAEKIIEVEEADWDRDSFQRVPESRRVQGVLIHTDPLRQTAQVTYGWSSDMPVGTQTSKTMMTSWT